jgi:hypothetical protein
LQLTKIKIKKIEPRVLNEKTWQAYGLYIDLYLFNFFFLSTQKRKATIELRKRKTGN